MFEREISLDIFRGFAVASMILVNTPGSWSHIYAPLMHSSWHGLTPTDLVFPFFLFAVGNSMFFAFHNRPSNGQVIFKVLKRATMLFGIGIILNAFPFSIDVENLRVMGVLQRIALCYLASALLILSLNGKGLIIGSAIILVCYWLIMGVDNNSWSLNDNLALEIDRTLIGEQHLYQGFGIPFDPEGILSTIGAIPTVLLGYTTAVYLAEHNCNIRKIKLLLASGTVLLVIGIFWSLYLPINKPLWSSSYTVVSVAIAQLTLALFLFIQNTRTMPAILRGLEVYGSNPLFIYAISWIFAVTMSAGITFESGETNIGLNEWLFQTLTIVFSNKLASLIYAIATVLIFFTISKWLYKKQIFIKI